VLRRLAEAFDAFGGWSAAIAVTARTWA